MSTTHPKQAVHIWLPRWIAVVAWALALFVIGALLLTRGPVTWDLPDLGVIAWVLGLVSFVLRRTIFSGILVVAGIALFIAHWLHL